MLNIVGKIIIYVISVLVIDYIVPGFELRNFQAAFVAAIAIGVINTFIRPIIQILALPFTIITLGIAAFIINAVLLMFVAAIVPGFEIDNLLTAIVSSIMLTLIISFFEKISQKK